jgi:hypothetical protein
VESRGLPDPSPISPRGGGRESNPPGSYRPHTDLEDSWMAVRDRLASVTLSKREIAALRSAVDDFSLVAMWT